MEYFRGDIVYIRQKGKVEGSEQGGNRPAIIVSNDTNNRYSEVVEIVYLTTAKKSPLPTHVDIMCDKPSTALCEQIYSLSKERIAGFVKSCTTNEMQQINKALKISLGLKDMERIRM